MKGLAESSGEELDTGVTGTCCAYILLACKKKKKKKDIHSTYFSTPSKRRGVVSCEAVYVKPGFITDKDASIFCSKRGRGQDNWA